jgi:hypothetical protein
VKRISIALASAIVATVLAASGQAFEVVGTVVKGDPGASKVVVTTPDGTHRVYRVSEGTRIERGDTILGLRDLPPGSQVQIIAEPPPGAGDSTAIARRSARALPGARRRGAG